MKLLFWMLLALLLVHPPPCAGAAPPSAPGTHLGLSVSADGTLIRNGRPYRGIGVNYFDAFARTLAQPGDTSYEQGFKTLAEHKVPFARLMGCGFWPVDNQLYLRHKALYFERFDGVVRAAEKYGIGLIPSLCWNMATVPDLVGEPCAQWGNRDSKTHAFMRAYVKDVVTRYQDSPAIWGWEFGNEYNLEADLPNAAEHHAPIHPALGTALTRSARDELTHDMIRAAFAAFGAEVRKYDTYRIICSGNALPRLSAWHQRTEKSWTQDTPAQAAEMLVGDNPDPLTVISVHAYAEDARIGPALEAAHTAHKPLFIGEFGVSGPPTPATEQQFKETLSLIERAQVPLAALWAYDFSNQHEWSVTAANPRAYQLQAIAAANQRLQQQMAGH